MHLKVSVQSHLIAVPYAQSEPDKFKCLWVHQNCLNLSKVEVIWSAGKVQIYAYSTMELNLFEEWELCSG